METAFYVLASSTLLLAIATLMIAGKLKNR